jgi:hypothetical protein
MYDAALRLAEAGSEKSQDLWAGASAGSVCCVMSGRARSRRYLATEGTLGDALGSAVWLIPRTERERTVRLEPLRSRRVTPAPG